MATESIITMTKKIFGFWHLWLTNHFQEVIIEQLQCLMDSGLYDASENIYVGLLGDNQSFRVANKLFESYPKIIISEYSTDSNLYEFQTLNILKQHVHTNKENYYVYYIHGKGLSFAKGMNDAGFNGGNLWRQWMNEYTINRWRDNVKMLDFGYEVCGTQIRPKREWRMHFSGNYFFAKSEYVRILKPVFALNIRDRFESEFWICSENPIAATLSQEFVDYYNHPHYYVISDTIKAEKSNVFELSAEPTPKGRTIVHTLCWAIYDDIEKAVDSLYVLNDKNDFTHILCDLSFPLESASEVPENIEEQIKINSVKLKFLAEKHGSRYVKMQNLGVSGNWNTISQQEKITEGDVLICCDPDEMVNPRCYGWVKTISEVLNSGEGYGVASLMMEEQFNELTGQNSQERFIGEEGEPQIRVIDIKGNLMMPQIGISGKLIKLMGGVPHPADWKIYGYLEAALLDSMAKWEMKWCMLPDFIVAHPEHDSTHLLRQWKNSLIFGEHKGKAQIHFEEWLKKKQMAK